MDAKSWSRSHGHPPLGLRRAAMISMRREMSRDGCMTGTSDKVELHDVVGEPRHNVAGPRGRDEPAERSGCYDSASLERQPRLLCPGVGGQRREDGAEAVL